MLAASAIGPLVVAGIVLSWPESEAPLGELTSVREVRSVREEPIEPLPYPDLSNRALIELGKRLFHDPRLSKNGAISCASCHNLAEGGDDGRRYSPGMGGELGVRNTPTVLNAVHNFRQFWDGRAVDLEAQAAGPLLSQVEMGWGSWGPLLDHLDLQTDLVDAFQEVFGEAPNRWRVLEALVAYEQALVTPDSPFDRWLQGEDEALSEEELQGYLEFKRVGCVACHQGVNVGGNMFQRVGRVLPTHFEDPAEAQRHQGRFEQTGSERDRFRFKVPSLRNVALTAPYLHDGSVPDLSAVIQFMAEHQLGEELQPEQVSRIAAFLGSLTGEIDPELLP